MPLHDLVPLNPSDERVKPASGAQPTPIANAASWQSINNKCSICNISPLAVLKLGFSHLCMDPVYSLRGDFARLDVFEDRLLLTPVGMGGLMRGFKGDLNIEFKAIQEIQHRKAGFITGYLRFVTAGTVKDLKGPNAAREDQNSITFDLSQNHEFEEVKGFIESKISQLHNGGAISSDKSSSNTSVADEIMKLAELHAKGVLTDEEFAAAKKNLIS